MMFIVCCCGGCRRLPGVVVGVSDGGRCRHATRMRGAQRLRFQSEARLGASLTGRRRFIFVGASLFLA